MIRVTNTIAIDDGELDESFVRASGPGGQNVNKLSSAVQLRFDVRRSPNLPNDVRARLERLAGSRLTRDGVLIISAQRHRTQERNRQDARDRLIELIRRAAIAPIPRRATKPTAGSRERRLQLQEAPVLHQRLAAGQASSGVGWMQSARNWRNASTLAAGGDRPRQGSGGVAIVGARSRAAGFARHPGADTLGRP